MSAITKRDRHGLRHVELFAEELCGTPAQFADLDCWHIDPQRLRGAADIVVSDAATVAAVIGWFDAELAPGVTLTNAPGTRNHWGQLAFAIEPVSCAPGDVVRFTADFDIRDGDIDRVRWSATMSRAGRELS